MTIVEANYSVKPKDLKYDLIFVTNLFCMNKYKAEANDCVAAHVCM